MYVKRQMSTGRTREGGRECKSSWESMSENNITKHDIRKHDIT